MKKSRLLITLILFAGLIPVSSHSALLSINNMTITGGTFGLDSGGTPSEFSFTTLGPNTNIVGGYIGNGGAGISANTPDPDSIVGLIFSGFYLNVYTAASNLGDDSNPAGTIAGGSVPSGTVDTIAGTITMDLSSWFANWNDNDIYMGTGKVDGITSAFATGTWDPITGEYSLSWQSLAGTPYLLTSFWTIEGVASPVPLPPALWLFGAGLLGLIGAARKKQF